MTFDQFYTDYEKFIYQNCRMRIYNNEYLVDELFSVVTWQLFKNWKNIDVSNVAKLIVYLCVKNAPMVYRNQLTRSKYMHGMSSYEDLSEDNKESALDESTSLFSDYRMEQIEEVADIVKNEEFGREYVMFLLGWDRSEIGREIGHTNLKYHFDKYTKKCKKLVVA